MCACVLTVETARDIAVSVAAKQKEEIKNTAARLCVWKGRSWGVKCLAVTVVALPIS